MYELFTGNPELVMNNRIVYYKDGEDYTYCIVVEYDSEAQEYIVVPFKDIISARGERRMIRTKEVYLMV